MKVIIVEDEKLSAEHLHRLLLTIQSDIEVVGFYDSVKSVVEAYKSGWKVDLIFMDIHLADGLCFEIFSQVPIEEPVIFTTAYNEYAIKAFKVNSIDYLLKPIARQDLQRALEKFLKQHHTLPKTLWQEFSEAYKLMTKPTKNRFLVKQGKRIDTINTEDIHHFQTQDSITFLVDEAGKRYPIDYTLDEVEELLPATLFFRINRKVILNINAIENMSTHLNSRLHITARNLHGDFAIVSRERVNDFKAWLDS